MTPVGKRIGLYQLVLNCTFAKIALAAVMYVVGADLYEVWAPIFVTLSLVETSWGFYDLLMADVIDEDRVRHRRPESVATAIHGFHALIVKPAQSIAPIFGVYVLSQFGLQDDWATMDSAARLGLRSAMFHLVCGVSFMGGILQVRMNGEGGGARGEEAMGAGGRRGEALFQVLTTRM
jgi:Na+/melibiose symporter-like transporter